MILYLVICVILLLYRLSINYHTSQPSPVSGLYNKGHVFRDLNSFNMYTHGGGREERRVVRWRTATHLRHQTTKSVRRILSNMEVDTEAQELADELTKWLKESASRSACKISVGTPPNTAVRVFQCLHHLPKVPVVRLFSFLSNSL